ncbi:AAA family ATPase [Pontibacter sp. H259]|uniref:AAA family ATPase n=1 Tax=Pontibacter sp. H259 TaxID=3133421 RepID=UPI0030C511B6
MVKQPIGPEAEHEMLGFRKDKNPPPFSTELNSFLRAGKKLRPSHGTTPLLKQAKVYDNPNLIETAKPCLQVLTTAGELVPIGTFGNFSLVIGKAKSRKSFFTGGCMAAYLNRQGFRSRFQANPPAGKETVLYFDTEQGMLHVQEAVRRVEACVDRPLGDLEFHTYSLRSFSVQERLKMVEDAIYWTDNLGLVVIDGVRELVTSVNDEEQATKVASLLLKWTQEVNIHIVCVLHQNKGDLQARGHLGTELINKAETVISITKNSQRPDISIVAAEHARGKEFEPFAFGIDERGRPCLVEDWSAKPPNKEKKQAVTPEALPDQLHANVVAAVFKENAQLGYEAFYRKIKATMEMFGHSIGDNTAKKFINFYLHTRRVEKVGKSGSSSASYQPIVTL